MALVVDTDKSTAKRNLTLQLPLALQNLVNFFQLIVWPTIIAVHS